jgi:translocation and assembly module TamA
LVQKYLKILFLLVCSARLYAQEPVYLRVEWQSGREGELAEKTIGYQSFFADTIALAREMQAILVSCNRLSFLNATYEDVRTVNDTVIAKVNLGNSYRWVRLSKGNITADILGSAGFREEQFRAKPFSPDQFVKRIEKMLQYLENNGYPFAAIRLDSIEADSAGITAALNLRLNELILFDTLELIGDANIKKSYLYRYLGIKPGSSYNEAMMSQVNSRISQLPFLKTSRASSVYFYGNKAMPVLYLENRKASSVDGVVGFAPNTAQQGNANKLLITGEANLRLQNLFGSGKSFDLNYRSFLGNSQDLKIKFMYPYILNTNLAMDYELNLLKQDTTFLDVKNEFGLQYRFIGTDYFKVFYSIQTTSLITVDTNQVKLTRTLPAAADLRNNTYGAGFRLTRFDYFLNPRKGFAVELNAGIGVKKIVKNPTINELKLINGEGRQYSLYDTMKLDYIQYRFQGMVDYFIPVLGRAAVRLQANGGHIVAENLFVNELFRIGGIRTLKGFDEQAIFASTYLIINTELRYLLQQNSNVIIFWNGAYYRNSARDPVLSDKPYGFGAGFNFETGAGIFSIFYAIGKEFNNPVDFNKAKVHFGFVNYF